MTELLPRDRITAALTAANNNGKVALVPFLLDGFADDLDYFQADRIHPNQRAQPRMLDNVWTVTHLPVPAQAEQGRSSRRIGLGITGLGDALIMLGLRYDSEAARVPASTPTNRTPALSSTVFTRTSRAPASSSRALQMNVRSSTRATSESRVGAPSR